METLEIREILDCLDEQRRLIHYHKDLYAIYLVDQYLISKKNCSIADLRKCQFAKLLHKPIIKLITAKCGDGILNQKRLSDYYNENYQSFVLTLSQWGCKEDYYWSQTSRPGCNIVLQLNFTGEHDKLLQEFDIDKELFKYDSHPISRKRNSLAWSRIDLDFKTGEALIEEVQNDWLRIAKQQYRLAKLAIEKRQAKYHSYGVSYDSKKMLHYSEKILKEYQKYWSEVMLFSTIQFIKEELGISRIYYHTIETARVLKNLKYSFPPVSLYTELPKKFCFARFDNGPKFLQQEKRLKRRFKKIRDQTWFRLDI